MLRSFNSLYGTELAYTRIFSNKDIGDSLNEINLKQMNVTNNFNSAIYIEGFNESFTFNENLI